MASPNYHHPQSLAESESQSVPFPTPPKPKPELLSLLLKSIIMIFLASLFFLFLGFAAFVLLHLCLFGGLLHRVRLRHTSQLETFSNRFSSRDVKKLPQFRFASSAEPGFDTQCVVCLDAFMNGQCCRKLVACGHMFHKRCVDMWLIKVAACPTCRTPVRLNASMLHLQADEADKQLGTYDTDDAFGFRSM